MKITEYVQSNILLFDGGTGTLLQQSGLPLGELPERWNLTRPEVVEKIHTDYFNAGATVVCTNTFGANGLKFTDEELENIVRAAVESAKRARERSVGKREKYIALDIGPCGKLLKPYGDLGLEEAVALFSKVISLGAKEGVDLIYIETMGDSYETKAATLAAKESCDLPVFVSCAYGADGKLTTGASPSAMVALLEGLRVDALGVNCSLGPKQMRPVVEELLQKSSIPVLVKPNAGLPTFDGGYDIGVEEFADTVAEFIQSGARIVGGCCGTTPAYIQAIAKRIERLTPKRIEKKQITCVSSYTRSVEFARPALVGERINPTGKKRLKQALKEGDIGYILNEGISQAEKGADILDVNVGAPEIIEKEELPKYIQELQAVVSLPLQIDTADSEALERAMRVYNGKPLVNSVNGKKESMAAVLPLVKKYGGVVVALTLDERGIPDTVEGRVEIAEKIIAEAKNYGVEKKDILVDPLAMAVSADDRAAEITLQTVQKLTERGIKTSLGISNVSFGLPNRELVNSVFFAQALSAGLSAAIFNPNSVEMRKVYRAHLLLHGADENCLEYIRFASERSAEQTPRAERENTLSSAIVKGLKEEAAFAVKGLLREKTPEQIVREEIAPALDSVGVAYEEKRAFLPQLLISAEAAKAAFEEIKLYMLSRGKTDEKKGKILLATVKGDIHDIGKNIVGALLENYGFGVVDLGKDVPPAEILAAAEREKPFLVGLSALMTTTLPSMAETTSLLKEKTPWIKVLVGGAVVNEEYAKNIGADGYAKDGMAAVRFAESIHKN